KVAIGTVKGDLHDIGKKLVSMMLEGSGFEIMDLGIDVPPDKFVDAVRQGAQVVALSALLTTTMPNMKNVVEAIQQAGLRENTRIIIGGAPVNQAYADHIGADGYAPDASSAVRKVRELVGVQ
ncbi:MAG: cobalamin-dependent protein, partial [Anaerolineae bacterium]|nr:cobalamin-dependent protein [Anaerolineae bacterium]